MLSRRAIARWLAAAIALSATGPGEMDRALAQAPPAAGSIAEGKSLYAECKDLFGARRFDEALDRCQRAYALDPDPAIYFTLGQIYRFLGRPADAVAAFQRFLALDSTYPPDKRRRVQGILAEEQAEIPTRSVAPSSAPVGVASQPTPSSRPQPIPVLPAPPASVRAAAPPITGDEGPARRPWYGDRTGGALLGSGAVATALGLSLVALSAYEEHGASQASTIDGYYARLNQGGIEDDAGIALLAVGGLALGAGLAWDLARRPASEIAVSTVAIPGNVAFTVEGRF